jgi:hypothetical protein
MKTERYLIISSKESNWTEGEYICNGFRVTKTKPSLRANEVAIKIELDVPDMLFQRPQLSAKIKVSEDRVSAPVIDATVIDNIQETIKQQHGIDLTIALVEPKSGE